MREERRRKDKGHMGENHPRMEERRDRDKRNIERRDKLTKSYSFTMEAS